MSNSAIYLLLESKQEDAAHELNNLYRIMNLLLSVKRVKKEQRFCYENLHSAVKEAQTKHVEGLFVPLGELKDWDSSLTDLLGIPKPSEEVQAQDKKAA